MMATPSFSFADFGSASANALAESVRPDATSFSSCSETASFFWTAITSTDITTGEILDRIEYLKDYDDSRFGELLGLCEVPGTLIWCSFAGGDGHRFLIARSTDSFVLIHGWEARVFSYGAIRESAQVQELLTQTRAVGPSQAAVEDLKELIVKFFFPIGEPPKTAQEDGFDRESLLSTAKKALNRQTCRDFRFVIWSRGAFPHDSED